MNKIKVKKEELIRNVAINLSGIKSSDIYNLMIISMFFRYADELTRKQYKKRIKKLIEELEQEIKSVKHI